MSQAIQRTAVNDKLWYSYLRVMVGQTVAHNLLVWSNITGKNSEPSKTSDDWVEVGVSNNLNSIALGSNVSNVQVTNAANDKNYIILSGTYNGPEPDKIESYSPNSMFREI